ncbi:nucleotidyl transferase AbiEii/AbiGii toxin family protein [Corticibacterium sp. UT-5YL-CI-8]|nr:nucleotidyl transferase AbiEii/AbiGii toxin family protein [Tianweitania sp. UT-5YL-CI-8]
MNAGFLLENRCYFGGGTAIVLKFGEYRLSLDVDFLCADRDGYRELRSALVSGRLDMVFGPRVEAIRAFRADQYGIRAILGVQGQHIRFEIVRESRVELGGAVDPQLHVPLLSTEDQVAEKLLDNADRCLDRAVAHRDAIDLGILVGSLGGFPEQSIQKAEAAYGDDVSRYVGKAIERLALKQERAYAAESLRMEPGTIVTAAQALHSAALRVWPGLSLPEMTV